MQSKIRNFCIIAHIDHGKSTLADRLLEITGTIDKRQMRDQVLDKMDLERERGITIKLAPVRMKYAPKSDPKNEYQLNLIDTPGHVDFSYEVSRSLEACEGALLVVDASQGIQAQTLANVYLALAADLKIIPVLNKIDLPAADVPRVSAEVIALLGCKQEEIMLISAKTGQGVPEILERVIEDVPPPKGIEDSATRALVFDSYYDDYRGVVLYTRVVDGQIKKGDQITMVSAKSNGIALEVGSLNPGFSASNELKSGEIGYIVTNFKSTSEAKVGDTVTLQKSPCQSPLPGYKDVKPFVYAGLFPDSNENYQTLKEAIAKLTLSDSALVYEPENSPVLGFGFRVGFLGLLHMDIVKERLEREYNLELIITNPSTDYKVKMITGEEQDIRSASELPDVVKIQEIKEPWIKGEVVCPKTYVGSVLQIIIAARGSRRRSTTLTPLSP